ncbi:MAG TPA: hypothetical protein VF432_32030 [Thermoanaerobaculia bacterium]
MHKSFLAIMLLAATFTFAATAPVNYAGTWTLDTRQSKDLPKHLQDVSLVKLYITQDNKMLKVVDETKFNGQETLEQTDVYNLDGTESKKPTEVRKAGVTFEIPATRTAVVADEGKLELIKVRRFQTPNGGFKVTQVEDWTLSADGKTLTVHHVNQTDGNKTEEYELVYVKE